MGLVSMGKGNDCVDVQTQKFLLDVMIIAVIPLGDKTKPLILHGTIDTDKYLDNIDPLHFIEDLNEKYSVLQWIF
jgi:hypothetical protein